MARYAAFLDACTIVPLAPCDTLLRMADAGAFRPLWSARVLDEAMQALVRIHPGVDPSRFQSRFNSMNHAFDDALVSGWEPLVGALELPDQDDRHVVAAALLGRADAIVTANVKDFPSTVLGPLGLEAVTVDDFLLNQLGLSEASTLAVVRAQAEAMRHPPVELDELLSRLRRSGAPKFAAAVDALTGDDADTQSA